jgi:hypothetical protein
MQEEDNIGSIIGKCHGVYILACGRKIVLRILIVSVMGLRFSMQEEDIIEETHDKCHVFTSQYPTSKRKIILSILMASVMCLHFDMQE